MLALTWADDAAAFVQETAALTRNPFAGNFVLAWDQHARLESALEAGLRIVSFTWGDPGPYVERVHAADGLVLHTVGSAEEGKRAAEAGVDVIVAQGWEAGGHVWGHVATLPLVPAVVDAVAPVSVLAAGGIGDGRGVAAVLALGAHAAWVGTRFLLAVEAPVHEEYRRRLVAAAETDAEWYADLYDVGWPNAPHRALRNATAEAWEVAGRPESGSRPERGRIDRHTSRPARQSAATPRRCRSKAQTVTSTPFHSGRDRAWHSRPPRKPPPTSSPSSSHASRNIALREGGDGSSRSPAGVVLRSGGGWRPVRRWVRGRTRAGSP